MQVNSNVIDQIVQRIVQTFVVSTAPEALANANSVYTRTNIFQSLNAIYEDMFLNIIQFFHHVECVFH